MTYHIFIGYDDRQHTPFLVAKHSLEKHSSIPIKVHKLYHKDLRKNGLFTRPWKVTSDGHYECLVDGRPFSTQFSHTRFLAPELWRLIPDPKKNPLVTFVDCDVLFRSDFSKVLRDTEDKIALNGSVTPLYAVQHNYNPGNTEKMDGMKQHTYNFKLWSSLMVFDMRHDDNQKLTREYVNSTDGRLLHSFDWISDTHRIGSIDESWNFLPDHSEKHTKQMNMVHYTEGGPWFENYRGCKYGDLWWEAYNDYLTSKVYKVNFDVEGIIDGG